MKTDWKKYIDVVPDFPKSGVNFLDINPLLANPKALDRATHDMQALARSMKATKIGAFDARGFLFGTPLAIRMDLPFFPIRKAGKLPGEVVKLDYGLEYGTDAIEIQLASVNPGDKVLLVDDVLATGGTMNAGINVIEGFGAEVVGCVVLANLNFLPGFKKVCAGRKPDFVKALVNYDSL